MNQYIFITSTKANLFPGSELVEVLYFTIDLLHLLQYYPFVEVYLSHGVLFTQEFRTVNLVACSPRRLLLFG